MGISFVSSKISFIDPKMRIWDEAKEIVIEKSGRLENDQWTIEYLVRAQR